jgi:outer membrane protein OmpA-like peptidoglycan-associated protein
MDTINNTTVSELTTDSLGKYKFTIEEFAPLKAIASNAGYFNNSLAFEGPADIDEEFYSTQDLCMTKIPNPIEVAVEVDNVYYDFNQATIKESSFASLDKLVKLLNDNPTMSIQLNAHTDNRGEEDYNQKLSDARANSVVNYLVKKGINKTRLTAKGFGESKPIADNENADGTDNPEGRQKNRRTEFQVVKL